MVLVEFVVIVVVVVVVVLGLGLVCGTYLRTRTLRDVPSCLYTYITGYMPSRVPVCCLVCVCICFGMVKRREEWKTLH